MQKRARIAVSALISVSTILPSAFAQQPKRRVAMVPPVVAMPAPHPVSSRMGSVSRAQIQRLANSSYPVNHFQRGLLLRQRGQLDDALIEFLKSVQENPLQSKAYYEQAVIFKQKGYSKLAQSALQQALSVKPDYKDARILLASLYLESGALTDAAQELFKSLGINANPAIRNKTSPPATAVAPGTMSGNARPGLSSSVNSAPAVMQSPHGHLFSPLSVVAAGPKKVATPERIAAAGGLDAFALQNGFERAVPSRGQGTNAAKPDASAKGNASESSSEGISELLKGIPGVDPQAGQLPGEAEQTVQTPVAPSFPGGPDAVSSTSVKASSDDSIRRQVDALVNQAKQNNEQHSGFHLPNIFPLFRQAPAPTQAPLTRGSLAGMSPGGTIIGQPAAGTLSQEMQNAQVAKMMQAAKNERNKHHVAGWVNSIKDDNKGNFAPESKFGLDRLKLHRSHKNGAKNFNPVDMFVRQSMAGDGAPGPSGSTVKLTESLPDGIGTPESIKNLKKQQEIATTSGSPLPNEKLPPTGVRVETITSAAGAGAGAFSVHGAESEDKVADASWLPTFDFSKLWHRAIGWMPMPTFKPFSLPGMPQNAPGPTLVESGFKLTPAAPLVGGASSHSVSGADLLPTQARPSEYTKTAVQPGPLPSAASLRQPAPGIAAAPLPPSASSNNGLEGIMAALPKEIAAGLQMVLAPKPVDVPPAASHAPALQQVNTGQSELAHQPSPVPAISQNIMEHLVTARVGAEAIAESEMKAAVSAPVPSRPVVAAVPTAPAPLTGIGQESDDWQFAPPLTPQLQSPTARSIPSPPPVNAASPAMPALPEPRAISHNRSGSGGLPVAVPVAPVAPVHNFVPVSPSTNSASSNSAAVPGLPNMQASTTLASLPQPVSSHTPSNLAPALVPTGTLNASVGAPGPTYVSNPTIDVQPMRAISANSRPVAQRLASRGFKFVAPNLSANQQSFVSNLQKAKNLKSRTPVAAPVPAAEPPEDQWTKRMRYLLANGTSSLGRGEAFMFSEETGEGVLFFGDGNTVRRKLASSRDANEVALQRRPDILAPKGELQYNLSLLGKIIKPQDMKPAKRVEPLPDEVAGAFSVNEILDKSQGFLGWLKGVFNPAQKKQ